MNPRRDLSTAMDLSSVDEEEAPSSRERLRSLRFGPYVWGEPVRDDGDGPRRVHLVRRHGDAEERFAARRIRTTHNRRLVRSFLEEARTSARLDHPNIVKTVDFGEQDGELVLVMELVNGVSCSTLLHRASREERGVPLPAALFVATEVLNALEYAHRAGSRDRLGVVHRDVSPRNILVGTSGEVKLTDFAPTGSDVWALDVAPTGYNAPELIAGDEADRRSDVFSLGAVLFEMLTGKRTFHRGAKDLESRVDELADPQAGLPLELRLILATALARDPGDRFETAGEFAAALRTFARHASVRIHPTELKNWLEEVALN